MAEITEAVDEQAKPIDPIHIMDNYVHKSEFEKIKQQNDVLGQRLLQAMESKEPEAPVEQPIEYEKFDFSSPKKSNIEYTKAMLTARADILSHTGRDVFESDKNPIPGAGEKVAQFLQSALDESEGDNHRFNAILQANLKDDIRFKR